MENARIRADVVEAEEFPHLAQTYQVRAVPKTIIDGFAEVTGAVSPEMFVEKLLTVVGRFDLVGRLKALQEQERKGG